MPPWVTESGDGVVLQVFVQPRASRNEVVGLQGEELKVRLTSPPVEGAANKSCTAYFAKLLGVSRTAVELVAGDRSRHKRLLARGVTIAEAQRIIGPLLAE